MLNLITSFSFLTLAPLGDTPPSCCSFTFSGHEEGFLYPQSQGIGRHFQWTRDRVSTEMWLKEISDVTRARSLYWFGHVKRREKPIDSTQLATGRTSSTPKPQEVVDERDSGGYEEAGNQ